MASKIYPFLNPAYYIYDPAKIEISAGIVKLREASWLNVYANYHLNESSGSIAADSSGNSRNGALVNMENEDWKAGKLNNCLEFDGENEEVNLGDIANFERTDPFSLELWFKTGNTESQDLLNRMLVVQPLTGWGIWMDHEGKVYFYLISDHAGNNYISIHITQSYSDSNWHHLIVTYDGSSSTAGIRIYVDGNNKSFEVDNDTLSASIQNDIDCRIAATDRASNHFEGFLDEVVIYDKELSQAEVTARWNSGDGLEELPGTGYPDDEPTIQPISSWRAAGLTKLLTFVEALGGGNQGSIRYQLSGDDGEVWLYWNGAAWAPAGAADYNSAVEIFLNIGSFSIEEDQITFKAFLVSDGNQQVELDLIGITAEKLADNLQSIISELGEVHTDTHFLKHIGAGCWEIKNNQMIFYEENSTLELMRFNLLDKAGNPAEKNIYKRCLP